MIVHNGYAVIGKDRKPLGLLHQKVLVRKGKVKKKGKRESIKWHEGLRESKRLLRRHKKVIQVCDREADIYFFIKEIEELRQGFVIRCAWNRKTEDGYIFDDIKQMELRGHIKIKVERNGNRKKRIVNVTIKSGKLKILPPKLIDRKGTVLEVNVVIVEEQGPANKENKIYWILLTSEVIDRKEDCLEIMRYYQNRWLIEEFHKGLKTGCKIENRQLQTRKQLEKVLGMFSIICYNLLLMRYEERKGIIEEIVLNPIQRKFLKSQFKKEIQWEIDSKETTAIYSQTRMIYR